MMQKWLFCLMIPFALFAKEIAPLAAKDYSHLIGMEGFEKKALEIHFTLYQGYVTRTNELLRFLEGMRGKGEQSSAAYGDIKRHLMWEYDGVRLHEAYFDNLGGKGGRPNDQSPLTQALTEQFGSFDRWMEDFKATGTMRGIGWVVLVRDPVTGRLINAWITEHDEGHLVRGEPILIMDVFEHAYMIQYGLDRKAYINAFFANINWPLVEQRFEHSGS